MGLTGMKYEFPTSFVTNKRFSIKPKANLSWF
jgi:hypothetical protein